MNTAYVSIGSNMGERETYLHEAVAHLKKDQAIHVSRVSSIYETAPVGYVDQSAFLNLVVELTTTYSAFDLLKRCQAIELALGRERLIRWGPRTVDLDILLYNNDNIVTESLVIPHPRMYERAFVLIPLLELTTAPFKAKEKEKIQSADYAKQQGVQLWKKVNE